jgi:hypothetical protein
MNIQLQNKWLTQYNEIYRAIAELSDEFEYCENVFENVLASLDYTTVLSLCLEDAVDDLINDIAGNMEDDEPHIHVFSSAVFLQAKLNNPSGIPVTVPFTQGTGVLLSLYNDKNDNISVIVTDDKDIDYYLDFASVKELIQ